MQNIKQLMRKENLPLLINPKSSVNKHRTTTSNQHYSRTVLKQGPLAKWGSLQFLISDPSRRLKHKKTARRRFIRQRLIGRFWTWSATCRCWFTRFIAVGRLAAFGFALVFFATFFFGWAHRRYRCYCGGCQNGNQNDLFHTLKF